MEIRWNSGIPLDQLFNKAAFIFVHLIVAHQPWACIGYLQGCILLLSPFYCTFLYIIAHHSSRHITLRSILRPNLPLFLYYPLKHSLAYQLGVHNCLRRRNMLLYYIALLKSYIHNFNFEQHSIISSLLNINLLKIQGVP